MYFNLSSPHTYIHYVHVINILSFFLLSSSKEKGDISQDTISALCFLEEFAHYSHLPRRVSPSLTHSLTHLNILVS